MKIIEVARQLVDYIKKEKELNEKGLALSGFYIRDVSSKKKFRLAKSIPEMIEKFENMCESECKKCSLYDGITCDGSVPEIASCNCFREKELVLK